MRSVRPGYGIRHSDIERLLAGREPAAVHDIEWGDGAALRVAAYTEPAELPAEFVGSVRCLVLVDELIVMGENVDGIVHPWPGGRRQPARG